MNFMWLVIVTSSRCHPPVSLVPNGWFRDRGFHTYKQMGAIPTAPTHTTAASLRANGIFTLR